MLKVFFPVKMVLQVGLSERCPKIWHKTLSARRLAINMLLLTKCGEKAQEFGFIWKNGSSVNYLYRLSDRPPYIGKWQKCDKDDSKHNLTVSPQKDTVFHSFLLLIHT